jgi:hypothetical protein
MDHRARLLFRVGLGPHCQRPEAEPGGQPIIQEIADGAAQPPHIRRQDRESGKTKQSF